MTNSVHVKTLTMSLTAYQDRPQLAIHIASIMGRWNDVEQEMMMLFAYGLLPAEAAISCSVFGCTSNLATKLQMIRTSLSLGVSEVCGTEFWKQFEQRIRKAAKPRNLVAHGIWTTHEDYPDSLIHTLGHADPHFEWTRYSKEDFLKIEHRLLELSIALREFFSSLREAYPRTAHTSQPKHWRIAAPENDTSDDPNQQGQIDPES